MATPGHTPGHASYVVGDDGRCAVIVGDAMHNPKEADVEIAFAFDDDRPRARAAREALGARGALPHTVLAGCHFPDLVFGTVRPAGARLAISFAPGQEWPLA